MTTDQLSDHSFELAPQAHRVEQMPLPSGEAVKIDTSKSLTDEKSIHEIMGVEGKLVASIRTAGMGFLLLDTRNTDQYQTPFLLTSEEYYHGMATDYKGLYADEPLYIGRDKYTDRFDYPSTVSRTQFSVIFDQEKDALSIRDENSKNGTFLTAYTDKVPKGEVRGVVDKMTQHVVKDIMNERNYGNENTEAPYGTYRNHPIIGRNSLSVRNGVYGTRSSEFVIVDNKSNLLQQVTNDFMESLPNVEEAATLSTTMLMRKVALRVANILRYNIDATERLSRPHYGQKGLIDLSEYVEQGVGVCRHQALLAAHLIEELIETGYIDGSVGVERNEVIELNGAHAWAVYRSRTAADVIVDPAQSFVGTRKEAKRQGRWRYELANDGNKG